MECCHRAALKALTGHTDFVNSVSFSPDGQTIASASGSFDNTVRLWDVATDQSLKIQEQPLEDLTYRTGGVNSVSFSPNGKTIASASADIRLWDVATGRKLKTLSGHTGWVNSVSFSPDGQILASANVSFDNTVHLWDAATGQPLKVFTGHTDDVKSVSFSHDGQILASASGDGTVLLWNLALVETEPTHRVADVNRDGQVDIRDLVAVAAAFGEMVETPADVNRDGQVDIRDLVAVAAAFGE